MALTDKFSNEINGGHLSNNHFPRGLIAASLDTSDKYKIKKRGT